MNTNNNGSKEKIVIGINSLTCSQFPAYTNHMQLMFKLGRRFPQYDFVLFNPPRMSIDRMRNMAAEVSLQIEAKYLIFIDDDIIVPFDFLDRFLWSLESYGDSAIMAGNVQIRGYPFDYMVFRWKRADPDDDESERKGLHPLKSIPKNQVIEVDAVGFSCVLIPCGIIKQLTKPYFITTANMTEDIWFCLKVSAELPETKFVCDTGIVCGHILWPEIMSEDNREAYKKYYETIYPDCLDEGPSSDRGDDYLKLIKEVALASECEND